MTVQHKILLDYTQPPDLVGWQLALLGRLGVQGNKVMLYRNRDPRVTRIHVRAPKQRRSEVLWDFLHIACVA